MFSGRLTVFLLILASSHIAPPALLALQQKESAPAAQEQMAPTISGNKKAALDAQRIAEADPSENNLFLYASSLMKLDYPSAEKIYRFAIDKYPDSVRLHAGLASALFAQAQRDEGAAELIRASELNPADPHPLELLVETEYMPEGVRQQVIDGLRQLRIRYPRDGLILFDLEMVLSNRYVDRSHVPDDFEPTLNEAIRLAPQLHEAYFQLSLVYELKKDYDQQLQALRHAVELSPRDEHYRYNLAMAYRQVGNKEAFRKEMSIFQRLHSQSPGGVQVPSSSP